jgi:tRNA threonylcarbamoyladenosine biosynthesis protein TsaB
MYILAADTTTPAGSVALLENEKLLAELNFEEGLTHSEKLLPAVDFLLHKFDLKARNIDGFAVAVGPGSFTGIRVGLSTFKSLAYASSKPVAPVTTLNALAWKLRLPQARLLCPVMDAKKGEVYAALFESRGSQIIEIVTQGAYKPDQFFSLLPARRVISFIGAGTDIYKEKIQKYFGDKSKFPRRSLFIAHEVGILGYKLLKQGRGKNFLDIEPIYLRRSQAEENL